MSFSDRVLNNSSERSEESRVHKVGVTEILPPFGRLDDNKIELWYIYSF